MNQEQNIQKWRYSKIARHDLPTKPKGSQSLVVAQTIVKIIIVHSSN
jgi:retron-type reverse transcriptase